MTPDALDITVAVILLLSAMVAYFRGIIREVFTIVALVAASGTSYFVGPLMVPAFERWLNVDKEPAKQAGEQAAEAVSKAAASGADAGVMKAKLVLGLLAHEHVAQICSYASVFLFIYFVMSLIGYYLTRAVAESGLTVVDRLLGAGFGLARGFLLVFLLYFPAWYFYKANDKPLPLWAENSASVPVLDKAVAYADQHLELTKMIEKRGDAIVLKLQKPAEDAAPSSGDEEDLKNELSDEEKKTIR